MSYQNEPQEWVKAYVANIRFLGIQVGEATRKLDASRRRTEREQDKEA